MLKDADSKYKRLARNQPVGLKYANLVIRVTKVIQVCNGPMRGGMISCYFVYYI